MGEDTNNINYEKEQESGNNENGEDDSTTDNQADIDHTKNDMGISGDTAEVLKADNDETEGRITIEI